MLNGIFLLIAATTDIKSFRPGTAVAGRSEQSDKELKKLFRNRSTATEVDRDQAESSLSVQQKQPKAVSSPNAEWHQGSQDSSERNKITFSSYTEQSVYIFKI